MLWLAIALLVGWLVLRPKKRPIPATLQSLIDAYSETLTGLAAHRVQARTLVGAEREAALDGIEVIEKQRSRAEEMIRKLAVAHRCDVTLPTFDEAEQAAFLAEARRELDREFT